MLAEAFPAATARAVPPGDQAADSMPGARTSVRARPEAGTPQRGAVLAKARELVQLARQHGYRRAPK